jgi:peptide-methionine (S)-S-oxide reductase
MLKLIFSLVLAFFITNSVAMATDTKNAPLKTAVFAGGCFWCMQSEFDTHKGVVKTVVGYTGGTVPNPTYEQVSTGTTGHAEAIEVTYDAAQVSYTELLDIFWSNVDPLDAGGQFCDRGTQYRAAIFVHDAAERTLAEQSKADAEKRLGQAVATLIEPAGPFYAAEGYHQGYYKTNPLRYKMYATACGRDRRLDDVWSGTATPPPQK